MAERKYSVPPCVRYLVYWYWYTGIPLYVHTCVHTIHQCYMWVEGTHFIFYMCTCLNARITYARIARVLCSMLFLSGFTHAT